MAQVYLSLGSNIDRDKHILAAIAELKTKFGQLTLSSLYECQAVGFDGASFYNLVAAVDTEMSLEQVASFLRDLEFRYGRPENAVKFSPRTLDIDILLYDDLVLEQPVQLPRAEITSRAFVLLPLAELAPELEHPVLKKSYRVLWQDFSQRLQTNEQQQASDFIDQQAINKVPAIW